MKSVLRPFYRVHRIDLGDGVLEFPLFNDHAYNWFARYAHKKCNWHEPSITKLISDLRQPDAIFFDIGAHLGYFSCVFSSREGTTSLAFELDPANFEDLMRMVRRAKGVRGRIKCLNMGISDRALVADMPLQGASAISSLDQAAAPGGNTRPVPVTTLDGFCREYEIVPDVIKVDIEGYEWEFLSGAQEILSRHKPLLIIEVHPAKLAEKGLSGDLLVKALGGFGYDILWFGEHRGRFPRPLVDFAGAGELDNYDIVCKARARR